MGMTLAVTAIAGLCALIYAACKAKWIRSRDAGEEKLVHITALVADGAMAFLGREYRVLVPFVLLVAAALAIGQSGALRWQAAAFVVGAGCSALAGFFGMKVATSANGRTTYAARTGLNDALRVSFSGGSVMGLCVVGLALLGLTVISTVVWRVGFTTLPDIRETFLPILTGFSLGASSIALFARVGGGIYTKAADIGADLVGKLEADIPEDDARNPATIADNVGDNVGDVAGMGADLFESYVGSIVGCMILGAAVTTADPQINIRLVCLPLLVAGAGVVASIAGMQLVRVSWGEAQRALNAASFGAALLAALVTWPVCLWAFKGARIPSPSGSAGALEVFACSVVGLLVGVAIGLLTEYYTGANKPPVRRIVVASQTGAATTLITGLGVGMMSVALPIACLVTGMLISYQLAGLYGIGVAALGMLSTLAVQLAVDAYGPIADNAGGLAQMAGYPPVVRRVTDNLDSVGNTTAAIGKGFAIGSAALTAIILFSAYRELAGIETIDLTEPRVLAGLLIGGMIPYVFSSLTMGAVGRAAFAMIEEVRRQFRTTPGLLEGHGKADYARCIDISTRAALREMILPGLLPGLAPILVGFIGGVEMLGGLLGGVMVSGVLLAIFMSNSGGAWDNAKKMIEEGAAGGKGSEAYKAAVVGDTVGDPFKDTSGPSLNILIKVIAIVSLVIAPVLKTYWELP